MKLNFREFGTGLPLIILHGLYGSSDNWVSIARSLSDRFRVILPDQRNHGSSPHDPVHTYEAMVDDLFELSTELGFDKFYLCGHSMGGKTAINAALRQPDKILALTVIDISPFIPLRSNNPNERFHHTILDLLTDLDLSMLQSREEADMILSRSIKSSKIRAFLLKNLTRADKRNFSWKLNPEILANNLDNILEGFERNKITQKAVTGFPVLFIRASLSGYIPDEDIELIEQLFPAVEIVTIEDTSHWIHAERPQEIIKLLSTQFD